MRVKQRRGCLFLAGEVLTRHPFPLFSFISVFLLSYFGVSSLPATKYPCSCCCQLGCNPPAHLPCILGLRNRERRERRCGPRKLCTACGHHPAAGGACTAYNTARGIIACSRPALKGQSKESRRGVGHDLWASAHSSKSEREDSMSIAYMPGDC